jgi:XTP/dITP diphosphohydrolase
MRHIECIVLATCNQHKIEEIKNILGTDIAYRTLSDYVAIQIREAGRTLLENSLAKATYAYKVSELPSLADDSGLFIDALDGGPGIFSARYGKTDQQRITRILDELRDSKDRRASFKAVFVLSLGTTKYEAFEGICPGIIADEPRGIHGFGYDPVFIPEGYTQTFAELGSEVKNRISHRARALQKVKEYLKLQPNISGA